MYLKELRLLGFKSFADNTVVRLEPGMTAIVGPNGCGKSNLADAIRWVLGEQSAKSLRAGAIADVIFQGTAQRAPLNLCEVTLVFADCEAQLGTAYHEVELTRRVSREGSSRYFLNGKACRLRDMQQLFLGTGVGQVSYSFLLQGQIDQVLSSRPEERRAIFEEAAGTSRYKTQRRETLQKLQQMEANLERLDDLVQEVDQQAARLERQAQKAIRYRRLEQRSRGLGLACAAHRYAEARGGLDAVRQSVDAAREECDAARAAHEVEAEALLAGEQALETARSAARSAAEQLQTCQNAQVQAAQKAELIESRLNDQTASQQALDDEQARARDEQQVLEARLSEARQRLEAAQAACRQLEDDHAAARQQLETSRAAAQALQSEVDAAAQAHTQHVEAFQRLQQELVRTSAAAEQRQAQYADRVQTLERESDVLAQLQASCDDAHVDAQRAAELLRAAQADLAATSEACAQARDTARQGEAAAQTLRKEQLELQAQRDGLQALQTQATGSQNSLKTLAEGSEAPLPPLRQVLPLLRVDPGAELLVATALGAASEAAWLAHREEALQWQDLLDAQRDTRATLILPGHTPAPAEQQALPVGVERIRSRVQAKDPQLNLLLDRLLHGCWAVTDAAAARKLWYEGQLGGWRLLVTAEGDTLSAEGVYRLNHPQHRDEAAFLQRARHLEGLEGALGELKARLERAQQVSRERAEALAACQQREQQALEAARQAEKTHQSASLEHTHLQQRAETLQAQLEAQRAEHSAQAEQLKAADAACAALQVQAAEAEANAAAGQRSSEATGQALARQREDVEAAREAALQAQLALGEQQRARDVAASECQQLEGRLSALGERLGRLSTSAEGLLNEAEQLRVALGEARARIEAAAGRAQEADTAAAACRARETEARDTLRELREAGAQGRAALDAALALLHERELTLTQAQTRLDGLVEAVRRDFDVAPEEIDWRAAWREAGPPLPERLHVDLDADTDAGDAEAVEVPEAPDWAEAQAEVERLQGRLKGLGPVNLDAIDEFKALQERQSFLHTQRDDLVQARDELQEAIEEINATSAEQFLKTFEQVRENFAETFARLFGGGSADLQFEDPEDPLETGITIIAQPPGTRLRSLQLLSGGQRTLTAVALLFAIYLVKPSPFCVLDEIDAPLDDANIGRFTEMLREYLRYSQFLVITHNKRTLESADMIYGATMPERGVTQLLSMRMDRTTGKPQAA